MSPYQLKKKNHLNIPAFAYSNHQWRKNSGMEGGTSTFLDVKKSWRPEKRRFKLQGFENLPLILILPAPHPQKNTRRFYTNPTTDSIPNKGTGPPRGYAIGNHSQTR